MKEFCYKWSTLFLAILNNILRNIAILKNYLFPTSLDNHLNYYSNLNILEDNWFENLPDTQEEQRDYLSIQGIQSYLVEIFFYDFLLKNNKYSEVIDFGCGNGRLAASLASINPEIKFTCVDVNQFTERLNEIYLLDNIKFTNSDFEQVCDQMDNELPKLLIARMSLAYLDSLNLNKFINTCSEKNLDLAIADVTRFRLLTESPKISYTQNSQPVYAHPYEKLLLKKGYSVNIDVQKNSALMNFTSYLFPEFLTFIFAKKVHHPE